MNQRLATIIINAARKDIAAIEPDHAPALEYVANLTASGRTNELKLAQAVAAAATCIMLLPGTRSGRIAHAFDDLHNNQLTRALQSAREAIDRIPHPFSDIAARDVAEAEAAE